MQLSAHDLTQLTEQGLCALSPDNLLALAIKLLADVKELHDRLNQNPQNSSRPPSTRAPWERPSTEGPDNDQGDESQENGLAPSDRDEELEGLPPEGEADTDTRSAQGKQEQKENETKNKPGKQPGAAGYGRKFGENMEVTGCQAHRPNECAVCNSHLPDDAPSRAYTARDEIEIERPSGESPGINVTKLLGISMVLFKIYYTFFRIEAWIRGLHLKRLAKRTSCCAVRTRFSVFWLLRG